MVCINNFSNLLSSNENNLNDLKIKQINNNRQLMAQQLKNKQKAQMRNGAYRKKTDEIVFEQTKNVIKNANEQKAIDVQNRGRNKQEEFFLNDEILQTALKEEREMQLRNNGYRKKTDRLVAEYMDDAIKKNKELQEALKIKDISRTVHYSDNPNMFLDYLEKKPNNPLLESPDILVVALPGTGTPNDINNYSDVGWDAAFSKLDGLEPQNIARMIPALGESGNWYSDKSIELMMNTINRYVEENNIKHVVICGYSEGTQGVPAIVKKYPDYFDGAVSASAFPVYDAGYSDCNTADALGDTPFLGYYEDVSAYGRYKKMGYVDKYGKDGLIGINCSHEQLPVEIVKQDSNNNGISDFDEYILSICNE